MGNLIEAQFIELDNITSNLRKLYVKAYLGISPKQTPKYWLFFRVSVSPLGWNTYFISKASQNGNTKCSISLCLFFITNMLIDD